MFDSAFNNSGADYQQLQAVDVQRGGNLVLVDWFTSGR